MKLKLKYAALSALSYFILVSPVLTVLLLKWDRYTEFSGYGGKLKLTAGGVIACALIFMMMLGKLKLPRGIIVAGAVFALTWMLEAILANLKLLCGMFLLGETLYYIFFQATLKRLGERVRQESANTDKE
jgi:hypothetical protein